MMLNQSGHRVKAVVLELRERQVYGLVMKFGHFENEFHAQEVEFQDFSKGLIIEEHSFFGQMEFFLKSDKKNIP